MAEDSVTLHDITLARARRPNRKLKKTTGFSLEMALNQLVQIQHTQPLQLLMSKKVPAWDGGGQSGVQASLAPLKKPCPGLDFLFLSIEQAQVVITS